jgi:hypothetical protein
VDVGLGRLDEGRVDACGPADGDVDGAADRLAAGLPGDVRVGPGGTPSIVKLPSAAVTAK